MKFFALLRMTKEKITAKLHMRDTPTTPKGLIVGIKGTALLDEERAFIRQHAPLGVILFGRNVESPLQVQSLVGQLKLAMGHPHALVFIDQEGGRVQRLKPPHWPAYAAGAVFGKIAAKTPKAGLRAAYLTNRLIADDLAQLGINADCTPVLDLAFPQTHDVIGDRAYAASPALVAQMGAQVCNAMLDGDVMPVIKHIPGHGRATADSHFELPQVDASLADLCALDFLPFMKLAKKAPFAMTAHILYTALDPHAPATQSATIMQRIIRDMIGYKGLVMTDDLSMKALTGSFEERSTRSLQAGCDILLHCNGDMAEMAAIASVAAPLLPKQMAVLKKFMPIFASHAPQFDRTKAETELAKILARYA